MNEKNKIVCVECNQIIDESEKCYYSQKEDKTTYIHKHCYESLLPNKKNN